jgi:hypothetical protein
MKIIQTVRSELLLCLIFIIDLKQNENEEITKMMLSLEMGEASIAKKLTNMYDRKMNMMKSTFYCEQKLIYSDDGCSS